MLGKQSGYFKNFCFNCFVQTLKPDRCSLHLAENAIGTTEVQEQKIHNLV